MISKKDKEKIVGFLKNRLMIEKNAKNFYKKRNFLGMIKRDWKDIEIDRKAKISLLKELINYFEDNNINFWLNQTKK